MPRRNVGLSEDAYDALAALKGPGETFSDVVRRLVRPRSLTELSTAVSPDGAEAIARAVQVNRRERARARARQNAQ